MENFNDEAGVPYCELGGVLHDRHDPLIYNGGELDRNNVTEIYRIAAHVSI